MTAKVRAFFSDCMPEHAATAQGVWQFTITLYHNTFKKVLLFFFFKKGPSFIDYVAQIYSCAQRFPSTHHGLFQD